jgi:pyruvate/2-oxoglutarate dehydrogenase complex dihydrolipoamide dehydrogenase (E3) component
LSQHFASLGTSTTIVEATERLLPLEEPETSTLIAQTLKDLGIRVITGHTVASISPTEVSLDDGSRIEAEHVFIATGRRPVTTGLTPPGLETDSSGALKIDAGCRTTLPTVFAAGDVAGLPQFVYVAAKSGRVAARNAMLDDTSPLDLSVVPRIVFGLVPIASVGITEAQANAQGITPRIGKLEWSDLPRALARSDLRGFAKVIVDPQTDLILGATIVGEGAENAISELAVAMSTNTTSQHLLELLHPYLTTSEAVRLALQSIDVPVKGLSCCA